MQAKSTKTVWNAALLFAFVASLLWYQGMADPLTAREVDTYMTAIDSQPALFRTTADKESFKRFLLGDDGAPFYTVNFYRYHGAARYGDAEQPAISGREAFDRFSSVMVRLLAARASHPIFGSDWLAPSNGKWDRMVIVRYRSRRDIAEIFSDPAFALASQDKWAGIDQNARFLVQGLHIPAGPFLITAILLFLMAGRAFVKQLRQRGQSAA